MAPKNDISSSGHPLGQAARDVSEEDSAMAEQSGLSSRAFCPTPPPQKSKEEIELEKLDKEGNTSSSGFASICPEKLILNPWQSESIQCLHSWW